MALSLSLFGALPIAGAATVRPAASPSVTPNLAAKATASSAAESLRVASFNVRCANCSRVSRINGREKRWEKRRAKVVSQIRAEKVDVIALQEASPGRLVGKKISQFEDLTKRLGSSYRLTNSNRYGCAKSTTYKRCTKVNNGASADVRIVYKTRRLALIDQGSKQLDEEKATSGPRFLAWAIFRDKTDGRKFFFANTHVEPGQSSATRAVRAKQAAMIVAEIKAKNRGHLPVVMTGDFAATKLSSANQVYDALMNSGLVIDPLGNSHLMKSASHAIVDKLINTKYDTLNNFEARPTSREGSDLGAYIDYILTSTAIRVLEYKVVLSLKSNGEFAGVIPSDHNMVRATIRLH
ncbi:MAG: endonuclease/exonuclease/phosphatase family protein [Micropruina sp.]|uniref:endonuclease/exonuclease/phosphatase family protein n=1 Tax=Micropruina sp. TaxID=2737536 RepID=UPI0039E3DD74